MQTRSRRLSRSQTLALIRRKPELGPTLRRRSVAPPPPSSFPGVSRRGGDARRSLFSLYLAVSRAMRRCKPAPLASTPHKPRHRVRRIARVLPVQDPSQTEPRTADPAKSGGPPSHAAVSARRRPFNAAAARPNPPRTSDLDPRVQIRSHLSQPRATRFQINGPDLVIPVNHVLLQINPSVFQK